MIRKILLLYCITFLIIVSYNNIIPQNKRNAITGFVGKEMDSIAIKNAIEINKANEGLLEKPIDPSKYLVGPYDEFSFHYLGEEEDKFIQSIVTPEGKLIIPSIGIIDLKDKTLEESYELIEKLFSSVFKNKNYFYALSDLKKFKVAIAGIVQKTLTISATSLDRVSEIIDRAGGFDKNPSQRDIVILRNDSIINVDLIEYYYIGNDDANPFVRGGDKIIVRPFKEKEIIEISGDVPNPMEIEYKKGDMLSTLIKIGQGFNESSLLDSVEFVRLENGVPKSKILDLTEWENNLYSNNNLKNDFFLKPRDRVYIRRSASLDKVYYVRVAGEIKYPGKYAINQGVDRVKDIIEKAGGFTKYASLEASYMIRQKEIDVEDLELERLKTMIASEMSESEIKYFQARKNERKGVMAISFEKLMKDPNSIDNIVLVDKDSIIISEKKDFVNVQGRVNNPGYVKYIPEFTYIDYINLAGGFGYRADEGETFITKSKGEQFLAEDMNYDIEPGDVILIPPEKEITFLEIFTQALTITAQLVTVVAIGITLTNR